jgi:hypothetical protein
MYIIFILFFKIKNDKIKCFLRFLKARIQKPTFKKNLQISIYGSSTLAKNIEACLNLFIYFHVYLAFSQIWLNIHLDSLPLLTAAHN